MTTAASPAASEVVLTRSRHKHPRAAPHDSSTANRQPTEPDLPHHGRESTAVAAPTTAREHRDTPCHHWESQTQGSAGSGTSSVPLPSPRCRMFGLRCSRPAILPIHLPPLAIVCDRRPAAAAAPPRSVDSCGLPAMPTPLLPTAARARLAPWLQQLATAARDRVPACGAIDGCFACSDRSIRHIGGTSTVRHTARRIHHDSVGHSARTGSTLCRVWCATPSSSPVCTTTGCPHGAHPASSNARRETRTDRSLPRLRCRARRSDQAARR